VRISVIKSLYQGIGWQVLETTERLNQEIYTEKRRVWPCYSIGMESYEVQECNRPLWLLNVSQLDNILCGE